MTPTPCPACGDPVEGAEYCELHDPGLRVAPLGDWSWGVIAIAWVAGLALCTLLWAERIF
jgi:hypothetical protein